MNKQDFGKRFQELRKALPNSLRQGDFSALLGWNEAKVKNIESGRKEFSDEILSHIREIVRNEFDLEINSDWWETGDGDVFSHGSISGLHGEEFGERFKEARKALNISLLDVKKATRWTEGKIKNVENGTFGFSESMLWEFIHAIRAEFGFEVCYDWLRHGKPPIVSRSEKVHRIETTDHLIVLFYEDVAASAGPGENGVEHPAQMPLSLSQDIFHLSGVGIPKNDLTAIRIKGYSMEPLLKQGELVMVEKFDGRWVDGQVYVVRLENDIFVKQVQKLKDRYRLISANHDYEVQEVAGPELDQFEIIGRVVMRFGGV